MKRKVIQLTVTFTSAEFFPAAPLFALCDDGSIWNTHVTGNTGDSIVWRRLPNVPQTDEEENIKEIK